MVPLTRGPAPRILAEKAAEWTQSFIDAHKARPGTRPHNSRYGHPGVRVELRRMSHGKCFYCERKLTEAEEEIDHYVEVAGREDGAFDWSNLNLSCKGCNSKKAPNSQIPVSSCVDPCDPTEAPLAHLGFHDEHIEPREGSAKGLTTIRKYCLNREDLDYARCKALREFDKALAAVLRRQRDADRKELTEDERELLHAFADPIRPFSLMMSTWVRALDL